MCMYITPCRQKILNNDGELGFNGPGNLSFARALWSEVPVAWHFKFGVLSSEIICNILASIFERSCSLYSGTMRDARHPTSRFSAQQMQQSSDATIEVAERHGSTAAAATIENSLRLHPKMNQALCVTVSGLVCGRLWPFLLSSLVLLVTVYCLACDRLRSCLPPSPVWLSSSPFSFATVSCLVCYCFRSCLLPSPVPLVNIFGLAVDRLRSCL